MRSDQFTLRPLDAVAVFHPLLKCSRLLLLTPSLQRRIILTNQQCAVALPLAKASVAQRAALALSAKFETVINVAGRRLDQATTLRVEVSGRTHSLPLLHIDPEL